MRRCTRCVMPETWEGITFDEEGICSICREAEKLEKIDWEERQKQLIKILDKYRAYARNTHNKYNCLVGYSGGKDTAYTLWAMVKKYDMKPLVLTFDHGFKLSPESEWNLKEIPRILDCDHLRFSIGNGLRNALCKKASEVMGDFCWHCHNGIGAFPARVSLLFNIPLQIWGEPSALYQTMGIYKLEDLEEQDKEHFEKTIQAGITPEMVLPDGYELIDLQPMTWLEDDTWGKLKAINLGTYEPWNQREHVEIVTRELGWKHRTSEITYVDWDKVDCQHEDVREFQKYLRRGFGKVSFQASKDIRDGLMTRELAMELIEKYEGKEPSSLDDLIREMGMTKEELTRCTNKRI